MSDIFVFLFYDFHLYFFLFIKSALFFKLFKIKYLFLFSVFESFLKYQS